MCARVNALEDGVALMERVLAQDDANFDALNFIGYTWAEAGVRLEDAERYIRRAVLLRPDAGGILDSLAWVLYRRGAFAEALEVQREAPSSKTTTRSSGITSWTSTARSATRRTPAPASEQRSSRTGTPRTCSKPSSPSRGSSCPALLTLSPSPRKARFALCLPSRLLRHQRLRTGRARVAHRGGAGRRAPRGNTAIPDGLSGRLAQYLETRSASLASISNDGERMLISTRFGEIAQLHEVRMLLGARTQLTFFDESLRSASYAPNDPMQLFYLRDAGGTEDYQLFSYDRRTGEERGVTGSACWVSSYTWDRSGAWIAYSPPTSENGMDTDVWMFDVAGDGGAQILTEREGSGTRSGSARRRSRR